MEGLKLKRQGIDQSVRESPLTSQELSASPKIRNDSTYSERFYASSAGAQCFLALVSAAAAAAAAIHTAAFSFANPERKLMCFPAHRVSYCFFGSYICCRGGCNYCSRFCWLNSQVETEVFSGPPCSMVLLLALVSIAAAAAAITVGIWFVR